MKLVTTQNCFKIVLQNYVIVNVTPKCVPTTITVGFLVDDDVRE